jgi:hypothetical protein
MAEVKVRHQAPPGAVWHADTAAQWIGKPVPFKIDGLEVGACTVRDALLVYGGAVAILTLDVPDAILDRYLTPNQLSTSITEGPQS